MKFLALFLALISTFSTLSSVSGDSIEIEDWNVTLYLQTDGNATARAYLGETVNWIGDAGRPVLQFYDDDDYYTCNITNATTFAVPNNVFETWPEGVTWKKTSKGAKYFATEEGCGEGERIKIIVVPKQFNRVKNNVCTDGDVLKEDASFKGGQGKCKNKCAKDRECLGFQWTKLKKLRTCTFYSNYPIGTGGKQGYQKVLCGAVKEDNTVEEEDEDEDEED
mmetsp:Transcript_4638/g.8901  ORF Transcript_4638/g.8901 Transcript_4638/m.8901 type:complete len:222 (-) Transcript_4638:90-755(-)|eukprot:CAMPEP_0176494616 /NCGR_PEP_ID=MMETSP0200_2-20121128/10202_1 /TAXON_ID=947934 /ORGANISM="Chaetoceros sp., Strain GSL56" /LENGTH=221 /DNA_ID=CAMNT_0017892407 /DNA_START=425 /DNA_END=1090 /DNA_ORIENTATION=-